MSMPEVKKYLIGKAEMIEVKEKEEGNKGLP